MLWGAPRYLEDRRRLGQARRELVRQISAEIVDKSRTHGALADWRAARNQYFDDFRDTFVEAHSKVSPEGRRKLVFRPGPEQDLASAARR